MDGIFCLRLQHGEPRGSISFCPKSTSLAKYDWFGRAYAKTVRDWRAESDDRAATVDRVPVGSPEKALHNRCTVKDSILKGRND
ncbi:MAG: hypothetical protein IJE62_05185 [Clostridia bacterium]|nr:hypothetical protein [Clostridia bacterium]MBQ3111237.1 hypothetical protein [Clostridia bacterium]